MKLSIKQIIYTLKWNINHLYTDVDKLFFRFKLRYLSWKYSGIKNVPPDILGKNLIVGGKEAEIYFEQVINFYTICNRISDQMNIPEPYRRLRVIFSQWVKGELVDVKGSETIDIIFSSVRLRLSIYHAMRSMDEITLTDIQIAKRKGDWEDFVDWLNKLTDECGE